MGIRVIMVKQYIIVYCFGEAHSGAHWDKCSSCCTLCIKSLTIRNAKEFAYKNLNIRNARCLHIKH